MALIQCIYCSAATDKNFSQDELTEILEVSRLNNAAIGVTGILLYEKGSFFQILEGEADTVDELFQKLCADSRHGNVSMIMSDPVATRTFSEWSMGFPNISLSEIDALPGLNDFFANDRSFLDIDSEAVRFFLDAFRRGEWHVS